MDIYPEERLKQFKAQARQLLDYLPEVQSPAGRQLTQDLRKIINSEIAYTIKEEKSKWQATEYAIKAGGTRSDDSNNTEDRLAAMQAKLDKKLVELQSVRREYGNRITQAES